LSPELFKDCLPGKFPLAPLLKKAAAEKLVTGEYFSGRWFNIGSAETYEQVLAAV
jgi:MurNAc alpha-1-phosphate uridylyltransferase